jgi:large subunit ribosomal protein L31
MKKGIHPKYSEVVFFDTQSDYKFITRSTMTSKETIKWEDGKEYPLIKIEVSSASHPFYTGKKLFVDTAGRIEKFNKNIRRNNCRFLHKEVSIIFISDGDFFTFMG